MVTASSICRGANAVLFLSSADNQECDLKALRRRLELVDIERVGRRAAAQVVERVLLDDAGSGDPQVVPRVPGTSPSGSFST